jgi:translation initiation factor 1A
LKKNTKYVSINKLYQGDIVLIGLREFQQDKADVIHKYTAEEARNLQSYGELPATARINVTAMDMATEGNDGDEDDDILFEDVVSAL